MSLIALASYDGHCGKWWTGNSLMGDWNKQKETNL